MSSILRVCLVNKLMWEQRIELYSEMQLAKGTDVPGGWRKEALGNFGVGKLMAGHWN